MINERKNTVSSEVAKAMVDVNEKKRICKMCVMNNGQCKLKDRFNKDFISRSCSEFKLRKEIS